MELTPTQIVGRNVRAEMARRGVSQEQIARALDFKQSSVSKRLRGVTPFDINELIVVAQTLDVPLEDLLHGAQGAAA